MPRARSGDLQVAIVWQPEGSHYKRRGSLKAYLHTYIDSPKKGYVSGVVTFLDDSTLVMIEVLIETNNIIEPVKYRYHYMDKNQAFQFRYDNAAHFKNLSSFPHHKHILANDDEKVIATPKPTLSQILDEISDYVFKNFAIF